MQIQELIYVYKAELERAEQGLVVPLGQTLKQYKEELRCEIRALEKLDSRVRKVVQG